MIISWVVTTRQRMQENNPQPKAHTHTKHLAGSPELQGKLSQALQICFPGAWFPTEVPTDVEMDFQMYPVSLWTSYCSHSEHWG